MGCISRINELDLFVSLPHQLVGVVAITEISDAITAVVEKVANEDEDEDMEEGSETSLPNLAELFYVGQWVRCRVSALQSGDDKQKKVIELSLKPSHHSCTMLNPHFFLLWNLDFGSLEGIQELCGKIQP